MRSVFFPQTCEPSGRPLLVHLAAISANYNRIDYALECSVGSVKPGPTCRVVLNALVPDESQAGPFCIQLVLHGRWRNVCSEVLKLGSKIRVECAKVSEVASAEPGIHSFQLELIDPPGARDPVPRMRLYGFSASSTFVVACHSTLDGPMRTVPTSSSFLRESTANPVSREQCNLSWGTSAAGLARIADQSTEPTTPAIGHSPSLQDSVHVDVGVVSGQTENRDISCSDGGLPPTLRSRSKPFRRRKNQNSDISARNVYVDKIASLWKEADTDVSEICGKRVNIYGVVLEARGPCITKGVHLRSEVVIADPSSSTDLGLKTISLHRFEALPQDAIPFRAVGDVIRAHRVELNVYDDPQSGTRMLQAAGRFFSTYVLWAGESDSEEPIATVEPVRTRTSPKRFQAVEHTITEEDKARVAHLRSWGSAYLNASTVVDRPFLKTVQDVGEHAMSQYVKRSFDLVCCFEGQPEGSSGVRFIISDGLSETISSPQNMKTVLHVHGLPVDRSAGEPVAFEHFAPSWHLRPDKVPTWLLIRDAFCIHRNGSIEIQLVAGTKTSTMVWLRAESPEVRFAKGRLIVRKGPYKGSEDVHLSSGHQTGIGTILRRATLVGQNVLSSSCPHKTTGVENILDTYPDSKRLGDTFFQRASHVTNHGTRDRALEQRFIITTHANEDKPPTPIGAVHKELLLRGGASPAFRIVARALAVKEPAALCQACKPVCASCKVFLSDVSSTLICEQCESKFASIRDANVGWAFDIALILEDDDGFRIDAWLSGPEASTFFAEASPMDLNIPTGATAQCLLRQYLDHMLKPENVLDCSIAPFVFTSCSGVPIVACKIFGTALLPVAAVQI